jgi:ubiquinone/menaquinone biosynthesis C-methylase UbiE
MNGTPEAIQSAYYEKTAASYDHLHTSQEDGEHYAALEFISAFSNLLGLETFLDVGAGTGRGVRFLRARGKIVSGIEPVRRLIDEAEAQDIPSGTIVEGSGYALPYEDNSIDAVFECGVLHHVAEPARVVAEMMRVARKAVFLSDSNRFGQGRSYPVRMLKLALYKTRLWNLARYIQTGGKMYSISDGDGLYYSYSVFDSYDLLARQADRIWVLPTSPRGAIHSWLHPLLTSTHSLLCAIKANQPDA